MAQPADLAYQVLKLEQQLEAYQKLHAEELGELWRVLNECKRALAYLADGRGDGLTTGRAVIPERASEE
jgi:diadenosine tetraphosphate (Ap4A) HIT family hydrolase